MMKTLNPEIASQRMVKRQIMVNLLRKRRRYEVRLQPEGFTPPADSTEYHKIGDRYGILVPLEEEEEIQPVPTGIIKNSSEGSKVVATRKSARKSTKATTESEGGASEGDTSAKTATPSPKASTSKASSTPASQFKSPNQTPTSSRRRGKTYSPKKESAGALDIDNIDKFLEEHGGEFPNEAEMWANPPDFSFEDDFMVPENSDLNKVRLNVVSGSPRSIQRRLVVREHIIDPDATVKEDMLRQLKRINPAAKWWIKTGWCEITCNKALRITGKLEFTGDEDLGDGSVLECQELYRERLKNTRAIGVANRKSENAMREDLFRQIAELQDDNVQLCEGLRKVRATRGLYKSKMGVPERAAVDAAVDKEISTYVKLLEKNQDLRVRVERALSQGSKARVITLRNDLSEYLTQLTIRMRTMANYVVIFMISDELQNSNPHSWPVRMVPVNAITRELVETLREQLMESMVKEEMEVVGVIRDELTPHLAVCSPERAVCITQLLDEARSEVSTFHPSEMEKYFTIVTLFSRSGEMKLTPQWRHAAVPDEDVVWVYNYSNQKNATFLQGLQALHNKLFPAGYTPFPFRTSSKAQSLEAQLQEDQLRALMAIYIFRHKIKTYAAEGIDFDNYLYAPAVNPVTQQPLHVRDSVTKLLRAISRQAKDDTDLTTEKRQRLSRALDCWFKASVNTWWTPEMRREGNQALLDFVLEEWMPYEVVDRRYSAIDVNRPVDTVSFLSEDLLISLIVNVESENQRPALHPWAATCQDVNTFVHLIKNPGQRQNDSRQIMHPQIIKKLCIEFSKAIDPDLEFYYYWGDHEKTLYNILLNLNDPRTKRSATGPKYRKKKQQQVVIKEEKEDSMIEEEEEHSKDATEEDEEEDQMEISMNADEEATSSQMAEQRMQAIQAVEMPPIPIAVNPAAAIDEQQQQQQTVVTVTAPGPSSAPSQVIVTTGEGGSVIHSASTEDIIAAELLRQIEASLQAGVAVVTVTESSQSDAQPEQNN
ncbi:uncharacterized protein [Amphiura filiformis]|uniref:uncharacterized protein isoform X2 n=1 Tax=Amphiura filiformis TaxID=82378 RepID=UPI003B21B27E